MRKTLVVAGREYAAAVKTKSFLISLILLPVMMSGSILMQRLAQKIGDTTVKRVAVIDRTPGAKLIGVIEQAVAERNRTGLNDESGRQVRPSFEIERVAAADAAGTSEAADAQRLALSNRVRSGELLAFVEIGSGLLDVQKRPTTAAIDSSGGASSQEDQYAIRYSTNRPTYRDFQTLLQSALPSAVFAERLAGAGMSYQQLRPYLAYPQVVDRGLASRSATGGVSYESKQSQIAAFIVPLAMLMLMFIVTLIGASPMTANVVEEKQLRIAEVLLGSVRPFELMMGKLLGGVGVALTLAAIYFSGAYYVAMKQGVANQVSTSSILWFLFFTVIATLMYGSMFVAAGAAVTNIKESQSMLMPVMLLIMLPMLMITNMIQDPSGPLAMAASFFPFSAPMVMTARLSIPPGAPAWQAILSAAITIVATVVLVWAAGRIFRVGILMQGQGAKIGEMLRWVVKG